jgi:hypothetical protein
MRLVAGIDVGVLKPMYSFLSALFLGFLLRSGSLVGISSTLFVSIVRAAVAAAEDLLELASIESRLDLN